VADFVLFKSDLTEPQRIETAFTVDVLIQTEIEYSAKLRNEVRYELSATYSATETDAIEAVLSGSPATFALAQIEERFNRSAEHSAAFSNLMQRRSVHAILQDLYRLGAIGNSFPIGSTGSGIRNRWAFQGDPTLLGEKRIEIHSSLL
jgi:hypothetical protein